MQKKMSFRQDIPELDHERGYLKIGNTASGREIAAPYLIKRGRGSGPCLWVNAAVHGDELNGVFAALKFFRGLDPEHMNGTVVVTPASNVLALDDRRKTSIIDGLDMDQCFPGRAEGFITERTAARLFEKFGPDADVVVNIHTLGTPFDARPYAVYKEHPNGLAPESAILRHIACFDPTVACRMPTAAASGELPGNIAGALDYQALAGGAIAFMIELGGGGRYEADAVAHGVEGLRRLCGYLGILQHADEPTRLYKLRRVTARAHKLTEAGGLFHACTPAGCAVAGGESIGTVSNVFGDVVEDIVLDRDTWVIAIRRDPVVHSGDRVAFLGAQWDEVDVTL
jgi:uncharacterized protein